MVLQDTRSYVAVGGSGYDYLWQGKTEVLTRIRSDSDATIRRKRGVYIEGYRCRLDTNWSWSDISLYTVSIAAFPTDPNYSYGVYVHLLASYYLPLITYRYRRSNRAGHFYYGNNLWGRDVEDSIIMPIPSGWSARFPPGAAMCKGPGSSHGLLTPPTDWSDSTLQAIGIYRARDASRYVPGGLIQTKGTASLDPAAIVDSGGQLKVIGINATKVTSGVECEVKYLTSPESSLVTIQPSVTVTAQKLPGVPSQPWIHTCHVSVPSGARVIQAGMVYAGGLSYIQTVQLGGVVSLPAPDLHLTSKYIAPDWYYGYRPGPDIHSPHRRYGLGDVAGDGYWPYCIWLGDMAI
jgi:hypothetical protein